MRCATAGAWGPGAGLCIPLVHAGAGPCTIHRVGYIGFRYQAAGVIPLCRPCMADASMGMW